MHVRNAVPLVWGSLRLTPITSPHYMYYVYLKLLYHMHSYFMTKESQNLTRIHAVIRLGELMFECGLCQFCTLFWEDEVENTKHQLTTFRLSMGAVLDVPMLHCWSHPNVLASFLGSAQMCQKLNFELRCHVSHALKEYHYAVFLPRFTDQRVHATITVLAHS